MPRRNKRVTIRATSVPELHQWLRALQKGKMPERNYRAIMVTKKQAKDLHI